MTTFWSVLSKAPKDLLLPLPSKVVPGGPSLLMATSRASRLIPRQGTLPPHSVERSTWYRSTLASTCDYEDPSDRNLNWPSSTLLLITLEASIIEQFTYYGKRYRRYLHTCMVFAVIHLIYICYFWQTIVGEYCNNL